MTDTAKLIIDIDPRPGPRTAPDLWGLFIEDLNDALDGGLNAEAVRNGDFEFSGADRPGWEALTAWDAVPPEAVEVRTERPIHVNNAAYAHLTGPVVLANEGWDGVGTEAGDHMRLAFFARSGTAPAPLTASIGDGANLFASAELTVMPGAWRSYEVHLLAAATGRGRLEIALPAGAEVDIDCVSLRPVGEDGGPLTFRPDLLRTLKELRPSFIRFPGGCVAHGLGLDNAYRWKDTIGPRHERLQIPNLWGYHQSRQIGYLEYFELCEATGATPLPVVAAGVCCQNLPGGAEAVPLRDMPDYIQDVLDLVEFANGPVTTGWGARRAELGHPEPFGLRYLGVGNEDEITGDFRDRFARIEDAVRTAHPGITVIGTVGPQPFGPDYDAGWDYALERGIAMVDEHAYMNPRWFHQNLDRFDAYDPGDPWVYLGEWAARSNTVRSALAEAAFMIAIEQRPEIVRLASYAPLLARVGHMQWTPDLVYFTADEVRPSASYYVQQAFAAERGERLAPVTVEGAEPVPVLLPESGTARLRSPGSEVAYDDIVIDGNTVPATPTRLDGQVVELGKIVPGGAAIEFTATRAAGVEGFILELGEAEPGSAVHLHVGGWRNKSTVVVRGDDGITCDDDGPYAWEGVRTGEPVHVAVRLDGPRVRVWIDGEPRHDYEQDLRPEYRVVAGALTRRGVDGGDEYVIRIVNAQREPCPAVVRIPGAGPVQAELSVLAGAGPDEGLPEQVSPIVPQSGTATGVDGVEFDLAPWSLTTVVMRGIR